MISSWVCTVDFPVECLRSGRVSGTRSGVSAGVFSAIGARLNGGYSLATGNDIDSGVCGDASEFDPCWCELVLTVDLDMTSGVKVGSH